jgi:hypothetical protein
MKNAAGKESGTAGRMKLLHGAIERDFMRHLTWLIYYAVYAYIVLWYFPFSTATSRLRSVEWHRRVASHLDLP